MRLFQAPLDTSLDSPFPCQPLSSRFALHGLHALDYFTSSFLSSEVNIFVSERIFEMFAKESCCWCVLCLLTAQVLACGQPKKLNTPSAFRSAVAPCKCSPIDRLGPSQSLAHLLANGQGFRTEGQQETVNCRWIQEGFKGGFL